MQTNNKKKQQASCAPSSNGEVTVEVVEIVCEIHTQKVLISQKTKQKQILLFIVV